MTATETFAGIRVILSRLKNIKVVMTVRVACNLLVLRAVMFIQKSPERRQWKTQGENESERHRISAAKTGLVSCGYDRDFESWVLSC